MTICTCMNSNIKINNTWTLPISSLRTNSVTWALYTRYDQFYNFTFETRTVFLFSIWWIPDLLTRGCVMGWLYGMTRTYIVSSADGHSITCSLHTIYFQSQLACWRQRASNLILVWRFICGRAIICGRARYINDNNSRWWKLHYELDAIQYFKIAQSLVVAWVTAILKSDA